MLSDKLMKLRKARGLSQQDAAIAIGVTRQTVSNWEAGQGAPALDKAALLAGLYGVSLDDLANDSVDVAVAGGSAAHPCDLHVLLSLKGAVCRIECDDYEWQVSMGNRPVEVVDVDGRWLRVAYERPSSAGGGEAVRLIDAACVLGASIVEAPHALRTPAADLAGTLCGQDASVERTDAHEKGIQGAVSAVDAKGGRHA